MPDGFQGSSRTLAGPDKPVNTSGARQAHHEPLGALRRCSPRRQPCGSPGFGPRRRRARCLALSTAAACTQPTRIALPAAYRGEVNETHDHGSEAVDLLRGELQVTLDAVDSLDRKLALVVPAVAAIAALLAPNGSGTAVQIEMVIAATSVAVLAAAFALFGLLARSAYYGPEPSLLATRARDPYPDYYRDVAQSLAWCARMTTGVVSSKGWNFNMAAVSASCSMLLFLTARILEVH